MRHGFCLSCQQTREIVQVLHEFCECDERGCCGYCPSCYPTFATAGNHHPWHPDRYRDEPYREEE